MGLQSELVRRLEVFITESVPQVLIKEIFPNRVDSEVSKITLSERPDSVRDLEENPINYPQTG